MPAPRPAPERSSGPGMRAPFLPPRSKEDENLAEFVPGENGFPETGLPPRVETGRNAVTDGELFTCQEVAAERVMASPSPSGAEAGGPGPGRRASIIPPPATSPNRRL